MSRVCDNSRCRSPILVQRAAVRVTSERRHQDSNQPGSVPWLGERYCCIFSHQTEHLFCFQCRNVRIPQGFGNLSDPKMPLKNSDAICAFFETHLKQTVPLSFKQRMEILTKNGRHIFDVQLICQIGCAEDKTLFSRLKNVAAIENPCHRKHNMNHAGGSARCH